jgi:hypothetical protein
LPALLYRVMMPLIFTYLLKIFFIPPEPADPVFRCLIKNQFIKEIVS